MRYSEVKKILRSNGCYKLREGKRHEMWYSPITGNQFPVGRHDSQEAKTPTLHDISEQSGVKF